MNNLKRYDKLLFVKRHINGKKEIRRQSPFKHVSYSIIDVKNRIMGSMKHVIKELYKQDAQRTKVLENRAKYNFNKQRKINKSSSKHKELANFISNNEKVCFTSN